MQTPRVCLTISNSPLLLVFRCDYVDAEKVLYCFYKIIVTMRANLKLHNSVYILFSKHTYRPMRARIVA